MRDLDSMPRLCIAGPLMKMLSVFWQANAIDHCDLVLSSLMGHYKFYAPDPLLIGQDAGLSDIRPGQEPLRFFPFDPLKKPASQRNRIGNSGACRREFGFANGEFTEAVLSCDVNLPAMIR